MQMRLIKKRYLVFRSAYIIKNERIIRILPIIRKNGKLKKINLFEDCLISLIDYNANQSDIQNHIRIHESVIDLIKLIKNMIYILLLSILVFILFIIKIKK